MSLLRRAAKSLFAGLDRLMEPPQGPRLLIYHQVGSGLGRQIEVRTDDFIWQLDWLKANRTIVDLETAVRRWNEPEAHQLVVLTFDDGYRDTFTAAFPHLRERRFPFVLYLATASIENNRALGSSPDASPLTWSQIEIMLESGLVTLASHTHTHVDLRTVDKAAIACELETADNLIRRRTAVETRHFAYPWGFWSPQAEELVRERYDTAALGALPPKKISSDPHRLFRYPVQLSDGRRWFAQRLEGGMVGEEYVRRRLRGYRWPTDV